MKKILIAILFVMAALISTNAHALTPTANWSLGGGNPFWPDYDIYIGVYAADNSTTLWSQQLASTYNGGNPSSGSVNLTPAQSYLAGHRWYLLVDDNWGGNASYIQTFSITSDLGTYGAAGLPIYVPDNQARYAYIDIPGNGSNTIPEPATMLLLGLGGTGLALLRRQKA